MLLRALLRWRLCVLLRWRLRVLLPWRFDMTLLSLSRRIRRPMLTGGRRLVLWGAGPRRPGSLGPGRGFFLARLVVLRLLRLTRPRLGEKLGRRRRALRLPAGQPDR